MSCPEIVSLYNAIRTDTNQKMSDYITKLQSRYGDPRVYQAQQAHMRREEAGVLFDQTRQREDLLQNAYQVQVAKNREMHKERFKTRNPAQNTLPESQAPARRSRTRLPAQPGRSESAEGSVSQ